MTAIEIEDLRKVFRGRRGDAVVAVDGLSLTVERGEVFGLLGPNGAGKTTTVEICEGLQRPTSGVVRVLGDAWGTGADDRIRQRIGVSLQETRFFDKQTVREVLALFRSFYEGGLEVDRAIATVSLEEKADTRTASLSGGQRQRLAVAAALVGDPKLLFLDEPTTGLDPQSRRSLWEVVRGLRANARTVLLTTHYMDEAEQLCDRVAVIDHGRLIALDTPRRLKSTLGGEHVVEVAAPGWAAVPGFADRCRALPTVTQVRAEGDRVGLTAGAPHLVVPALLGLLDGAGLELVELSTRHATLEDVFVALTGRHLRDGDGE